MSDMSTGERRIGSLISGLEIEALFGRYDYDLRVPRSAGRGVSNICILYGDNGTGKTTVLNMLFHLLSPSDERGHRSYLGRVPFASFAVSFADETQIRAVREQNALVGAYRLQLVSKGSVVAEGLVGVEEDGRVTGQSLTPEGRAMIAEIAKRGLTICLLGDDRRLVSDWFPEEEHVFHRPPEIPERLAKPMVDPRNSALIESLQRTRDWLRQQLWAASSRGEVDSQQIYAGIIDRINVHGVPRIKDYLSERRKLIGDVTDLDVRSQPFAELGLVPRVDSSRFIESLANTSREGVKSVAQVVSSFVDSQNARLAALEDLNKLLHRYVDLINGFLLHKRVQLTVQEGISIVTDLGTRLKPEQLSSGEKHLFLLFSSVLTSSQVASLFLIDEPEISLNVKWQRRLIDGLVELTDGSQCQFFLASHSIELLSKHRNQVVKLSPRVRSGVNGGTGPKDN
jgi:energy-coupling factor transporter ATP-binding protein EcfA2